MKNFKLLLATTAILSIGAMTAKAEFSYPELDIKARADFITTISVSYNGSMDFGNIDPREGGNVIIDPDTGVLSGSAKVIYTDNEDRRGWVDILGVKGFYTSVGLGSEKIRISIPNNEEISLYEDEEHSIGECAKVGNLSYTLGEYDSSGTGKLSVYFSGTLNVDSDYIPTGGYSTCTGKTTVTFILTGD